MKHHNLRGSASWLVAIVVVVAALLAPVASAPPVRATPTGAHPLAYVSGGITGTVTWNGVDVSQANSPSSALLIDYNSHVDVRYFWNATHSGGHYTINTVRLQMFYFGFALATRDVPPLDQRSADMGWDAAGSLRWLIEGTYGLTASLIAANGTTMWSESFFMHLSAPYSLLAALPILLLVLLVYELYAVVRSGAPPTPSPKRGTAPPRATAPGSSSDGTASPGGADAPNEGTP